MAATAPFSLCPSQSEVMTATGRSTPCCASSWQTPELLKNRVLPDGPTARGAGVRTPFYLVLAGQGAWSSRWSEMIIPTNGRTTEDHLCKIGIHATKWPREPGSPQTGLRLRGGHAQWARPAGHQFFNRF